MPRSAPRSCATPLRIATALPLLLALAVASLAGPARAQQGVPDTATLDTPVRMRTQAGTFVIPYGYLAGRPPLASAQDREWEYFSFAFWMPGGRYVRKDAVAQPTGEPKDDGVTPPPPGAFMIQVNRLKRTGQQPADTVPPGQQVINLLRAGRTGTFDYSQEFGMLKIVPDRKQAPGDGMYSYYGATRDAEHGHIDLIIDCFIPDPSPSDPPLCGGTVTVSKLDVMFSVLLPRAHAADAMTAMRTAAHLLMSWRVEPPQTNPKESESR